MRKHLRDAIPVIDVFAGPGGLGEGFSALRTAGGDAAFRIALSIEMDRLAHRTLMLRSFFRRFPPSETPEDYYCRLRGDFGLEKLFDQHPEAATAATCEAWHAELGNEDSAPRALVRARVKAALQGRTDWVLIGGPPCQAYSLAGRSRNRGKAGYRLDDDPRARLYVQYLHLIADAWPAAFVMENVPGLLSASLGGGGVFDLICRDLRDPAAALGLRARPSGPTYTLHTIATDDGSLFGEDWSGRFVVQCEQFGVPQRRRRIILIGVRNDMDAKQLAPLTPRPLVTVRQAIGDLPPVRSGLSKEPDSSEAWFAAVTRGLARAPRHWRKFARSATFGGEWVEGQPCIQHERTWFVDGRLGGFCNHSTRSHIRADLWRYRFAAQFAEREGRSPSLADFAKEDPDLLPDHANVFGAVESVAFADRFRVQLADEPATTITSHISKDGHYYIHYDPMQCRSLTVREAARLQSFPDNYFFEGPRTAQYVQVGNAVPPLLARQVAERVFDVLKR